MVELGESNVPLTEDIIKRTDEFVPTFFEFLSRDGLQIIRSLQNIGASTVLYTVPARKRFYLTSLNVSGCNSVANTNITAGISALTSGANWSVRLKSILGSVETLNDSLSLNFTPPIFFEEAEIFTAFSGDSVDVTITGIEVDKEIAFRR